VKVGRIEKDNINKKGKIFPFFLYDFLGKRGIFFLGLVSSFSFF